ncbi:primase-polymerase (primpol)-like protein [Lipingzhangella halophila]|uniref:Primase-polymerase (Primpol)-like protein n=1 Tax=Lipingzhangella halophila TaxID=1783352 RepID=A0A7W7RPS9_9ACTN|nr:bifunctional DNA primase/polymerase [Lipingzhangella halophila]MBB4935662.1 primase-polymerase (primpol)-like protein [Lipingzhangella halophila]
MTSRRRWVRRDERKVPLRADGRPASSTGPATWTSYSTAARSRRGVGLGYVLAVDDGIVCIDLDHCLTGGRIADWAQDILDRAPATYTEISPSGTGLHLWGRGHIEHGRRIRTDDGAQIEIYGQGRYIALGVRYADSPATLADLSEVINALT